MSARLFSLIAHAAGALALAALAWLAWAAGAGAGWPLALLAAGLVALLAISRSAGHGTARSRGENATVERLERKIAGLEDLVLRDPATGLYNRRALFERLEEETARARRHNQSFAVVLLDIDRFKAVNDRHGHAAGDAALGAIAARLDDHVRISDLVARYGGEEFVLLLPQTGRAGAATIAGRILRAVATAPIPIGEACDGMTSVGLTVSAGVAAYPEDGADGKSLLAAADRALYAAKRAGRNQIGGTVAEARPIRMK